MCASASKAQSIELLHFNDVYNVESRSTEPVGGAARFVQKVNQLKKTSASEGRPTPLVVFSGDAFNPSIVSTITKGKQMVPVLNNAGVDVAVYGNHDFDFGVDNLVKLAAKCAFPWLMSNVVYKPTGQQLADGAVTHVIDNAGGSGRRVGFIGLVENEWMATLATLDEADVEYEDFCTCGRRLATELRKKGCDLVVALTHMRVPNDQRLAEECGDVIDLILAGHDHHYDVKAVGKHGIYVCKSGTDFRQLTYLRIDFNDKTSKEGASVKNTVKRPVVGCTREEQITSDIPEDRATVDVLEVYVKQFEKKMETVIGETCVSLEARFSHIRTQETNVANYIADMLRLATRADVAIINSGTLRADAVFEAGPLLFRDLMSLLPMLDMTCVVRLTGAQLLKALENGVSQYPKHEGRFPCVSGVRFTFDARQEPGCRILRDSVFVNEESLIDGRHYNVATKAYLASGKDGYDVFQEGEMVLDPELGPHLQTLVRNTFTELLVINGFQSLRFSILRYVEQWKKTANIQLSSSQEDSVDEKPRTFGICPQVEGRIVCKNPTVL